MKKLFLALLLVTSFIIYGSVQGSQIGSSGGTLPTPGSNGQILQVVSGQWAAATASGTGNVTTINSDATAAVTLAAGSSGTDFAIADNGSGTHTFNLPSASATVRGALSTTDWSTFNNKSPAIGSASVTTLGTIGTGVWNGTKVAIAYGGTNSSVALGNNRMMVSLGGSIAEGNSIGASKVIVSDADGLPAASTTTRTQVDSLPTQSFTGHIEAGSDKSYTLDEYAAYPYTINSLVTKMASGTVSVAVKIGSTAVTGISSHSATSSQVTSTASAANSVVVGNRVTLVFSSSSSPVDFAFTLKYTR